VPLALHQLGLTAQQLLDHIGWDAGAAEVALQMSLLLDAPLILCNYSRLVIDCNRSPDSKQSILERSDGTVIPGNERLTEQARTLRVREIFEPYHQAIAAHLDARATGSTALLSIHSFTPMLAGRLRPWSVGVCAGTDRRLADPLLSVLRQQLDSSVGDNQPYSIETNVDYTLPFHAGQRGLPNVMLEISRDQIENPRGVMRWAQHLATAWQRALTILQ
jgi:predicted N-formylglutamate amidohydrolase